MRTGPGGFTLSLPPDWDVMDLAPESAARSTQRRVAQAVRRSPALARHRAELAAVMDSTVKQSQDAGVRLAAGWSGMHHGRVPACAGLVVQVLEDVTAPAAELATGLEADRDAAADRAVSLVALEDGTEAVRLTETRSVILDRRSRTALPMAVTRYYVPAPTTLSTTAMLTFTSPLGGHLPAVTEVFARSAGTFAFQSTR